jgi:hypothetical protein
MLLQDTSPAVQAHPESQDLQEDLNKKNPIKLGYQFCYFVPTIPILGFRLIYRQCFGSRLDPDSIRSVDRDQDLDSESGSRKAKMTHKNIQK